MRSPFAALGFGLVTTLPLACTAPPGPDPAKAPAPEPDSAGAAGAAALSPSQIETYYVVLDGPPAVKRIPAGVDPRSAQATKAVRARIAEIEAEHAAIEPALTERGAEIQERFSRLANAIQILADESTARRIEALPGVKRVERVPLMERTLTSAVPVVSAPALWADTPASQGESVTIGIIDSGIDYTHADFGGPGTNEAYASNDPNIVEPDTFPTAKVVGGWDFVGEAYNPSAGVPNSKPDADPLDCTTVIGEDISGGHGTHVAGIAAGQGVLQDGTPFDGPYEASFDPGLFRVGAGVAPRAKLYALKVFGCQGSTTMLGAALERASDPNKDGSFDDRLDVVNGSLGSAYGLGSVMVGEIVTELTNLGTLVIAAAGNERQNFFVTSSPATYPEVLSVAASADTPLLTLSVESPPGAAAEYPASEATFSKYLAAPLAGELVLASPVLGCAPLDNATEVAGKIALLRRGSCSFLAKLTNAANAGAIGGVVIDSEDELLPFAMGGAPPGSLPIPAVMVTQPHGAQLEQALSGGAVAIELDPERYTGPGAEVLAGFSARGPSPIDGRMKPEITAPGVVDSAAVSTGADPILNQGTSMASPMIAGAAALVRDAQPGLSAYEVKAALVNATVPLSSFSSLPYGTGQIGSGRVDVERAARAQVTAAANLEGGEVAVSFGAVVAHEPTKVTRTFVVKNHGASALGFDAKVAFTHTLPGVGVAVVPEAIDVAAGQAATVEVTLSVDPEVLGDPGPDPGTPAAQGNQEPTPRHFLNEASGFVLLDPAGGGGESVVVPFHGSVRAAVQRKGSAVIECKESATLPEGPLEIDLTGGGGHPDPVVSVFQLGALDEENPKSATDPVTAITDLRAVGVATDLATAPSFEEARVFFGVAVTGTWTTPARGPVSVVSIEINSDQKGFAEYELRVEARSPSRPFRDSLVTRVYNRSSGAPINRHPINVVTPDLVQTHPFQSSVLVLSALLSEIGIDPANPVFDWTAVTERPDLGPQSEKVKGTFDAGKPLVDTARYGLDGAPLFVGLDPVRVEVSPEAAAAGAPIDLLLLHHMNTTERWEVVTLAPKTPGNLALTAQAPQNLEAGTNAPVTLVVTNSGTIAAPNAVVDGSVLGGEVVSAETEQGSCSAGTTLSCALGELAPGASVKVTATVRAGAGNASVALEASVTSDLACEPIVLDNEAMVSMPVLGGGVEPEPEPEDKPDPEDEVASEGGCACRAVAAADAGSGGAARAAWLFSVLGLLAGVRRARRRAIAPGAHKIRRSLP